MNAELKIKNKRNLRKFLSKALARELRETDQICESIPKGVAHKFAEPVTAQRDLTIRVKAASGDIYPLSLGLNRYVHWHVAEIIIDKCYLSDSTIALGTYVCVSVQVTFIGYRLNK